MLTRIAGWFGYPWFCQHDFKLINKVTLYSPGKRFPVGKEYHLACTKCSEIRRKTITV
jgi:hypothetical protein